MTFKSYDTLLKEENDAEYFENCLQGYKDGREFNVLLLKSIPEHIRIDVLAYINYLENKYNEYDIV